MLALPPRPPPLPASLGVRNEDPVDIALLCPRCLRGGGTGRLRRGGASFARFGDADAADVPRLAPSALGTMCDPVAVASAPAPGGEAATAPPPVAAAAIAALDDAGGAADAAVEASTAELPASLSLDGEDDIAPPAVARPGTLPASASPASCGAGGGALEAASGAAMPPTACTSPSVPSLRQKFSNNYNILASH